MSTAAENHFKENGQHAPGGAPSPIPFDRDAVCAHVEMLHELAKGQDGILPLCIYGENPDTGRKTISQVQHFRIGDVDGMTNAILAYENHPDANTYTPLAVMRRDLARGEKGSERDVIAVLAAVIDSDADAGRPAKPPVRADCVLETSSVPVANQQEFILFDRVLRPSEAKPLLEALHRASDGDHGTKDMSHVWRIPGTTNWPNRKKVNERNRPREPQPVKVAVPWDGGLTSIEELRRVLAPYMNGAGAGKTKPNGKAHDTEDEWGSHDTAGAQCDVAALIGRLGAGLRRLIMAPPIRGEDRSRTLASAITQMMRAGLSDAEIRAVVEAHPQGIGAKYIGRPDLGAEIARLRAKFGISSGAIFDPWDSYVVPPFPLDVLPDSVRRFVETQSRVFGCDPSALAMAALANFSGALDHRFALKMLRNGRWFANPRLWVLLVSDPSRKKTPILRTAFEHLEKHEGALWDAWKRECDTGKEVDKDAKDPPKPPRFVIGDITTEMLGEILSRHDRGTLVKRDEIAGWIGSMERYTGGKRGGSADRAFWLQSFDGGAFTVDRVVRGELRIRNLSVSIIGGIQPERFKELHGLLITSDGLLQRFLPVMMGKSNFPKDEESDLAFNAYNKLTAALIGALPANVIMTEDGYTAAEQARRKLHDLEQVGSGVAAGFQGFVGKLRAPGDRDQAFRLIATTCSGGSRPACGPG